MVNLIVRFSVVVLANFAAPIYLHVPFGLNIVTWWQRWDYTIKEPECSNGTPRETELKKKHVILDSMAAGYALPPPPPLEIHDAQAAEKWKRFKSAWTNYSLATELNKKPEATQVAT